MRRLYSDDAFSTEQKCPSYWEATASTNATSTPFHNDALFDVAIIGGGYTGQSAALQLARDENLKVVILEAGGVGWGASGRNGGFCCMGGGKVPYPKLIKKYGLAETKKYIQAQRDAVELVRTIGQQENIDFEATGQGEYMMAHKVSNEKILLVEQSFMRDTFDIDVTYHTREELHRNGMNASGLHAGIHTPVGFGLHPLKYTYGLFEACLRHGVNWFEHTPVQNWKKGSHKNTDIDGTIHILDTPRGQVRAKKVIVATNGYTPEDLTPTLAGKLLPVMSNIIVTRPLKESELQAQGWTERTISFDSRNLLHYFRLLPDNRLLFGGRGGIDASDDSLSTMRAQLTSEFTRMFPAWEHVDIDYFWRGFVCLSYQLTPHIGACKKDPSVVYAMAYHGNGVAMGTWAGNQAAKLLAGREHQIPSFIQRPLKTFPFPFLRKLYLKGAYLGYNFVDNIL